MAQPKLTTVLKKTLIASLSRRKWTRSETRTLLVCVSNRKEEFYHSLKKKHVYNNIIEDLSSSSISEKSFTVEEIKNKVKSLKMAYKTAVDNNNRTGAAPSVAPFMDLMDDIYGYENLPPEDSSTITCSVGIGRRGAINPDEEFLSKIEISLPDQNEMDSLSATSPSTSKPKAKRILPKHQLQLRKLEFAEKKLKLQEENKFKLMRETEAARERRHQELMLLLHKERGVL